MYLILGGQKRMLESKNTKRSLMMRLRDWWSQRRLKSLKKQLIKAKKNLSSATDKEFKTTLKKFNLIKTKYYVFLKVNNLLTTDLEKSFKDKRSHDLELDSFDEQFAIRLARSKLYKKKPLFNIVPLKINYKKLLILTPQMYGYDRQEDYVFHTELMKTVIEICRVNRWLDRESWVKHNVPINRLIKDYFVSAQKYLDIRKYYAKLEFDKISLANKR
jgi:hypothetical protein